MNSEPRRDWATAIRAGARWMINPVSEMGAAQVMRIATSLAPGPLFALREAMRSDSNGRRLLAERPDVGVTLSDMGQLRSLPDGSLGRSYHDFMDHPDTVPGYLLAALAYEGGYFEALPWDEELKWALERVFGTHDLSHVVSGYGADLAGEGLVIFFTLGAIAPELSFRTVSLSPFGALIRLMPPPIGRRRWRDHLHEAWDRGRAVARKQAWSCIAWEELLARPIEEVRREIGLPPLRDPGMCSANWGTTWLMQRIESGQGTSEQEKERLAAYRAAVEAGVPVRAFMGCPMATRIRIGQAALGGAPRDELMRLVEETSAPPHSEAA